MAEYNRLQNSFITGYLDPLLYGLFTTDAYNTGLKECLNYIPSSRGYLYRRPGTRFLDFGVPSTATENRIHAMRSDNGPLLFLISEGRVDFFSVDLRRYFYITSSTVYNAKGDKCSIPWKAEDIKDLSIYEFEGDIYIVHKDYPPHKISVLAQGNFELVATKVKDATYGVPNEGQHESLSLKDLYVANGFYSEKIKFKDGGIETFSSPGHYPSCQTFKGGRWYLSGCTNSPASIYASKAPDTYGSYRFDDFGVGEYYMLHVVVTMTKTTIFENYEIDGSLKSVKYESHIDTEEKVKVAGLSSVVPESTSTTTYTRYKTDKTDGEKAYGPSPDDTSDTGVMAQTKMLVVETKAETWTLKSDLQNDDAIELTETDMYGSRVNWLITQQRVIAGTNRSIWMDDGSPATPTTFDLVKTLGVTTSKIEPVIHSSMIIFVPADMRSVKAFNYDTDAGGYVLVDLSATARSLFKDSKVKDITIVEGRESILWILLENGKLLSCTLGSTYGWAEHQLGGDGVVLSMSAYHTEDDAGELFLAVQRKNIITVEALVLEDIVNTKVFTLCDCAIELDADGETQDLSKLSQNLPQPYSTGDEIQIVAGGWPRLPFAYEPTTIDVGPGHRDGIYIGYTYTSRCHMLWQELPVSSGQTSLGFFRKAISMAMQVYRSAGAECGWVSGSKKHLDPFQRLAKSNAVELNPEDYYSGIIKLSVPSNTNEQVNAIVECSYPLPMTIQAIETRYILQEV